MLNSKNECFIIAEAGVNHNGSIELAKKLVDAAVEAGADAVKFQTFKAEDLVTKDAEMAEYQEKNTGKGTSQLEMLKELELSDRHFEELKSYCDGKGILFLSTPHTAEAVDVLDKLVPAFKVASGDITNIPLLKRIAEKGKLVILSTGMSTLDEVKEAIDALRGCEVILLHCTTSYPCPRQDVNLRAMKTLAKETGLKVGYSDHTEGIFVSIAAAVLGAQVVEKHMTLDKSMPGPDHKASLEPGEFKEMVSTIREVRTMLGNADKRPTAAEREILKVARKSIAAARNIGKGQQITALDMAIKRPGTGIAPAAYTKLLGKIAVRNIRKDEIITWEMVK